MLPYIQPVHKSSVLNAHSEQHMYINIQLFWFKNRISFFDKTLMFINAFTDLHNYYQMSSRYKKSDMILQLYYNLSQINKSHNF